MTSDDRMGEGFRRLLWRRCFGSAAFRTPDPLNEYDDDYAALETEVPPEPQDDAGTA